MKLEKNSIDMTFQVSKDTVPKKKVSKDTSTLQFSLGYCNSKTKKDCIEFSGLRS